MPVMKAGRNNGCKVVSHVLREAKTRTTSVAVLFENPAGERITWDGYLSDAAIEYTIAALAVLGWDPLKHDGRIETLNGTDLLKGAEADLVVEDEMYEGKPRPKVRWINAPGGLGKGMAEEAAKSFSASLRQKILSISGPTPNRQPGPSRQPVAAGAAAPGKPLTEPDDDLPF